MFELNSLVRNNILNLDPYSSARFEFSEKEGVFLNANENPFGKLNRYPDPLQSKLKNKVSKIKNIPAEQIFIGNGSDEIIDLTIRTFCNPQKDKVIICPPTYGMYEVSSQINEVEIISINLTKDFKLDVDKILNNKENTKILFICSPNNPTGNSFDTIEKILQNYPGIVFLDEAYIDFSSKKSFLSELQNYPNLIISQTLSKAYGLAAARIGMAFAHENIIKIFNKIKPPYNVSMINQKAAIKMLKKQKIFLKNLETILQQKTFLEDALTQIPIVKKIYPSDSNFLLIEVENADNVYSKLVEKKIIVRNRTDMIKNCLRITIGTPVENSKLINILQTLDNDSLEK